MSIRIELWTLLIGFLAMGLAVVASPRARVHAAEETPRQEYYELRVYRTVNAEKRNIVSDYLEHALVPALNRQAIDRVGVFTRLDDEADFAIYVLIPYPTVEAFADLNAKLAADPEYGQRAAAFFARPLNDPAYTRINSKFMKAFSGMPVIELSEQTVAKQSRLFELRTYESHNADKARLKVAMFNDGEIQIMRDCKMAPVFYGETLIGDDVPNLTYLLSAPDMAAHDEHWAAFRTHPDWLRMKVMEKYVDTVSKIDKWYLVPTAYSQL